MILFCGLAVAGCEDVIQGSDLTLTLGSQTLEVAQGSSNTVSITVVRQDVEEDVTLSATGLPSGVTATFLPATLSGSATASTLTIEASGTATTGDATITISASTSDDEDSKTLTLTVTEGGSFALSATPATLNVARNGTANTTVSISRDAGFTGAVSLSASGLPAGVTASFDPASTTGTSSTLTFSANGSAALGAATVTITGAATGEPNSTTNVALTVVAAGSTTLLTLDFCPSDDLTWAAYQNEGGAWTRLIPDANQTISAQVTPKVAFALVFGDATVGAETFILQTTAAELAPMNGVTCVESFGATKEWNGSMSNLGDAMGQVSVWDDASFVFEPDATFTISAPSGAVDLVASRLSTTAEFAADKVIIRRGLNLANNATMPVLDFNAAEAVNAASSTLSISNAGDDDVIATNTFISSSTSATPTWHALWFASEPGASTSFTSVPASLTAVGDLHMLQVMATDPVTGRTRDVIAFFRNASNQTFALGADIPTPTITSAATTPYLRHRVQVAAGEYSGALQLDFFGLESGNALGMYVSRNYLGTAPTTWDVTVPDLSGVAGWNNAWGLEAGEDVETFVDLYSEPTNLFTELLAEGTVVKHASWDNFSATGMRRVGESRDERGKIGPFRRSAPRVRAPVVPQR